MPTLQKTNTVAQIKSKLGIAEVVGSYVKLQKAGGAYKVLCPFHSEKTPSMSISPERGSFHCFGCGKGGDIFSFVEEMEGLDFLGALKVLAERAGVEIIRESGGAGGKREREEKERLYEILDSAADFFHGTLAKNKEALLYLKGRGLLAKTAEEFRLGFAPDSWDALFTHLLAKKYTGEEMEKAGLALRAKEGRRGFYDRFRSRIMFPIADSAGRIVGFSGRILAKKEGEDAGAKYINSPETILYEKSKVLYGLDRAKRAIREKGCAILVEGQMDLILSHQAGAENAVAVSGTALTEEHLKTIKRFAEKIIVAFDGDGAGLSAAHRAAGLAIALGMEVFAAKLPAGKDPADLIHENPAQWSAALENALPAVVFFLELLREREKDTRAFRVAVQKEVLPLAAAIKSRIERAHFTEIIAQKIGISQEAVEEDLRSAALPHAPAETFAAEGAPMPEGVPQKNSRRENIHREIEGMLLWQEGKENPDFDISKWREAYGKILENSCVAGGANARAGLAEKEKIELVFQAEERYGKRNDVEPVAQELLRELELSVLEERRAKMMEEFSAEPAPEWQKSFSELSRRIEELKKGR